jgi:hypothetical protein
MRFVRLDIYLDLVNELMRNMNLSAIYYGTSSPTKFRRIMTNLGMLGLGFSVYGMWVDFSPSTFWYEKRFGSTFTFTGALFLFAVAANASGHRFFEDGVSDTKKGLATVILPFFLFGFAWFGIIYGAGAIFSHAFGKTVVLEVRASKHYIPSRRMCDYRLIPELVSPVKTEICMTEEEFGRFRSGNTIQLLGKQSRLGFYIKKWKPLD